MMRPRGSRLALFLVAILYGAAAAPPLLAPGENVWSVKGKLIGADDKKSEDVSGIACRTSTGFPRTCLVIDDNVQHTQLVTLKDGYILARDRIKLINNTYKKDKKTKKLELDGEGVAFANGHFYVIGSHGHPRDKKRKLDPMKDREEIAARIAASSQVIRILVPKGATSASEIRRTAKLKDILASESTLKPYLDQRLEKNGVTIEGVAIRNGRLYAGFRGPSLDKKEAALLSVSVGALFDGAIADPKLYRLPLGEDRGVRDLAVYNNGLLILAGPTADEAGKYSIYWWGGESRDVKLLHDLPKNMSGERKAEAILPLDENAQGVRVLVLFDGEKEGGPRAVTIPKP
jgi:hypothetical protein